MQGSDPPVWFLGHSRVAGWHCRKLPTMVEKRCLNPGASPMPWACSLPIGGKLARPTPRLRVAWAACDEATVGHLVPRRAHPEPAAKRPDGRWPQGCVAPRTGSHLPEGWNSRWMTGQVAIRRAHARAPDPACFPTRYACIPGDAGCRDGPIGAWRRSRCSPASPVSTHHNPRPGQLSPPVSRCMHLAAFGSAMPGAAAQDLPAPT